MVTVPVAVGEAVTTPLLTVTPGLLLDHVMLLGLPIPPETVKVVELFWQMLLAPVRVPTLGTCRTTIGTFTVHPPFNEVKAKFTVC